MLSPSYGIRLTEHYGIRLTEHIETEGDILYQHACQLGCEGIVSKRKGSRYVSGRSPQE